MLRRGAGLAAGAIVGAAVAAGLALSGVQAQTPAQTPAALPASAVAGWTKPFEPFKIADHFYYVGSADPTAYLLDTGKGLILLDVGYTSFAPNVLANIKALGFDPKAIKVILGSHAHIDHAGGLAEVKQATGAKLYISAEDTPIDEAGGKGDNDVGPLGGFPPVKVDHQLKDGEKVSLGRFTLTAHLTPGHTPGCTTWTMPIRVDGKVRTATFICSLTILPRAPISAERAALWSRTYAKFDTLPCDLFFASHMGMYDGAKKRQAQMATGAKGKPNPFIDPAGCKAFIAMHRTEFYSKFKGVGYGAAGSNKAG